MEDLLRRLEKYRKDRDLQKNEIAKMVGCKSPQVYSHWVRRGTVPKDYVSRVRRILGEEEDIEEFFASSLFDGLSHEELFSILRGIVNKFDEEERRDVFRLLANRDTP